VGGQVEAPTVPWLAGVVRHVGIVANQSPAGEVLEDGVLIAVKDRDVDICVIARLAAQPSVGSASLGRQ
jgi:hypothetical protein